MKEIHSFSPPPHHPLPLLLLLKVPLTKVLLHLEEKPMGKPELPPPMRQKQPKTAAGVIAWVIAMEKDRRLNCLVKRAKDEL